MWVTLAAIFTSMLRRINSGPTLEQTIDAVPFLRVWSIISFAAVEQSQ
jgi:hypothetical protein